MTTRWPLQGDRADPHPCKPRCAIPCASPMGDRVQVPPCCYTRPNCGSSRLLFHLHVEPAKALRRIDAEGKDNRNSAHTEARLRHIALHHHNPYLRTGPCPYIVFLSLSKAVASPAQGGWRGKCTRDPSSRHAETCQKSSCKHRQHQTRTAPNQTGNSPNLLP